MRPDPRFMGPDLACSPDMSALGQYVIRVMFALQPRADMCGALSRCPLSANSGNRLGIRSARFLLSASGFRE